MLEHKKDVLLVVLIQAILVILFVVFTEYDNNNEGKYYPMFQDVHVMIFIGFGYLMTFLKKYGFSAVGFNFLLGALIVQWAILCTGFFNLNANNKIEIGIGSLFKADIAAAAVLISMGAVLGRTTYVQLLIMGIVEIVIFSANSLLGQHILKVADAGASIFVHTFGAYFGLAVSYVLNIKKTKFQLDHPLESSRYNSDIFAMIGTIFLWLFWPSFNAIELTGEEQQRAVINTYLALASCCVTTFIISMILSEDPKFEMVHIQNSTLAGGVAVGATANLMIQPWGAIIIGITASTISVVGYSKITPWLSKNCGIRDTCGVHNLHGIPGVLAGLIGAFMAGIATESVYPENLYEIYPARSMYNETIDDGFNAWIMGRSAGAQAGYQVLAVVVTVAIAITSGLITGALLKFTSLYPMEEENHFNDGTYWILPQSPDAPSLQSCKCIDLAVSPNAM